MILYGLYPAAGLFQPAQVDGKYAAVMWSSLGMFLPTILNLIPANTVIVNHSACRPKPCAVGQVSAITIHSCPQPSNIPHL